MRRKFKKRSPVHMRLPELLRNIAWPIGERREIQMWSDLCVVYPLLAFVAVTLIGVTWTLTTPDEWIRIFVNEEDVLTMQNVHVVPVVAAVLIILPTLYTQI
jgi:hypothetical protein